MIFLGVGAVVGAIACTRSPRRDPTVYYDQFGKPIAPVGQPVGVPSGVPVYAGGGYPPYGGGYGGYSGMAVAGSAASGFMGGMLVSEMMHHSHGSDYGGGDYGGGDYGGGDYGGGGDGGFAADS
jgi:hypothetical protein